MNNLTVRLLNLRPRGLHSADPLTEPIPRTEAVPEPAQDEPHGIATSETLATLVARAEAEQGPREGAPDPGVMPAVPIADDYRDLRVFPAVVRGACRVGLTGIGTRGVHPSPPLPDYGLDRFTAGPWEDEAGPEFDQVAERMEAGFYQARRVFHRADTAGFPAVAS